MKKSIIILMLLICSTPILQANKITFTAKDSVTGDEITPDSIHIYSVTQNLDTIMIYGMEFEFTYTGVSENPIYGNKLVTPLSANPFERQLAFEVNLKGTGRIQVGLFDLTGRELYRFQDYASGAKKYVLYCPSLMRGLYMLHVRAGGNAETVKLLKTGSRSSGETNISAYSTIRNNQILSEDQIRFTAFKEHCDNDTVYADAKTAHVEFILNDPEPYSDWYFDKVEFDIYIPKTKRMCQIIRRPDVNYTEEKINFEFYDTFEDMNYYWDGNGYRECITRFNPKNNRDTIYLFSLVYR